MFGVAFTATLRGHASLGAVNLATEPLGGETPLARRLTVISNDLTLALSYEAEYTPKM